MAPIQSWCNLQNPLLKASSCYAHKVLPVTVKYACWYIT